MRHFIFLALFLSIWSSSGYAQSQVVHGRVKDSLANLTPKFDSLRPVIVTPGELRAHFRRDTVEFNTAHLKMDVNANVEQMIGRLRGLQVDPDGNITYNGQKIQRVLVDGREMFGSDLTIVTRNFNADMIAKVQIMDSKSKQAQFTGIDDGQRIKTLNLTLKEDSKNGYFVKGGGGGALPDYYQAGGILGAFKGKEQLMVLGTAYNNGSSGFSGNTGGLGTGIYIGGGANDPLGAEAGAGIPQAYGGAAHYANELGTNGDHADGYYMFGHSATRPFSTSLTEQILPDSVYTQTQQSSSVNSQNQQVFQGDFAYSIDSLSSFEFGLLGGTMQGQNVFNSSGRSEFNDTVVNTSTRSLSSNVANQNFGGHLNWRIRARKDDRRVFSILLDMSEQGNTTSGYLYSLDHFFQSNGSLQSIDTTDQRKSIITGGVAFNGGLNYTEPLWKDAVLGLSYGLSVNNSHSQQSTYNRGDGKYQDLVDSLSDHYRDIFLTQRGTLTLQGTGKDYDYVFAGDILQYNYRQQDLLNDSLIKQAYLNFAPKVTVNFHPSPTTGFSFVYSGSTQVPSITQLQPVQNNTNPLAITLGNPALRPSYTNAFELGFHEDKSIHWYAGLNVGLTNNGISTKTYTDSLGRQVSQQVNTSGSVNGSFNLGISKRLEPLGLDLGFNGGISYSRSVTYINDLLSQNDSYTPTAGFSVAKYVANSYHFQVNTQFGYSSTSSSVNTGAATRFWTQNHTVQAGFFPFKHWELNTNAVYTWRQKTSIFDDDNSVLLWNAGIKRNFLDNRLEAGIQLNDILGANAGISRSISANQISQTSSNVIGRYLMLSLVYHFTQKFASR